MNGMVEEDGKERSQDRARKKIATLALKVEENDAISTGMNDAVYSANFIALSALHQWGRSSHPPPTPYTLLPHPRCATTRCRMKKDVFLFTIALFVCSPSHTCTCLQTPQVCFVGARPEVFLTRRRAAHAAYRRRYCAQIGQGFEGVADVGEKGSKAARLHGAEEDGSRTCLLYNVEGLVPYLDGLAWQRALQKERIDHKVAHKGQVPFFLPDALVLLEHPVVYTLGSASKFSDILFPVARDTDTLSVGDSIEVADDEDESFSIHRVQRGGKVTYHCPGQIVGYPILNLARHSQDIEWYLRTIEKVIIDVLAHYDVKAGIEPGLTGVWVDGKKIAAIGVSASRWVTLHGWALNVKAQMKGFQRIVPCGIQDRDVVSLDEILGEKCPSVAEVRLCLARTFAKVFVRVFL
jgi:lipoyl(octanoyl) transferase